jgi:hypothetical protein
MMWLIDWREEMYSWILAFMLAIVLFIGILIGRAMRK